MNINQELKKYIEEKIMTQYDKNNYGGHGWSHIISVIDRSFDLANKFNLDINPDIAYVVASYHDIGYRKDPDNHEQVSSEIFLQDEMMKNFFTDEERKIIAEAIIDHRASLEYEARNIYGKLVSSADREISVENMLERSIKFQSEKHKEESPTINQVIEYSFKKLSSKYGKGGYAKMYFPDEKYEEYLKVMQELFSDKDKFIQAEREIIFSRFDILKKYFISDELQKYIQNIIFPKYNINDNGHGIDHIKYVIDRSFELIKENELDANLDMVYTIAAYHDIGHHIDSKAHEKVSADIMYKDENLKTFFTDEERQTIKDAIEDHRASAKEEPRSIYGRIVSSADRNNTVEACLRRTYTYGKKLDPSATDDELFLRAYDVLTKKFGEDGYAKFYFRDTIYESFLKELRELLKNKENYIETQRQYIKKLKKENKI